MNEWLRNVLWLLGGFLFIPVVVFFYKLLFSSFGLLGMVPAAYFGAGGTIAIGLCKHNKFFLMGMGILILWGVVMEYLSHHGGSVEGFNKWIDL